MIQKFAPEDNQEEDAETHSQTRKMVNKAPEFTLQEVSNTIQSMGNKNAPGEDGITNEVWKCIGSIFPRYLTAIYNICLRKGIFPKRWKKARLIPIVKPGKGSDEVPPHKPDSGRKVLEKLLINRINHVYSLGYMNKNSDFDPKRVW
jgi:hypothetical protein